MLRRNYYNLILFAFIILPTTQCSVSSDDAAPPVDLRFPETFNFGRLATKAEIDSLDEDISPDGRGLPDGSGSVGAGARIFALKCARCHGASGREGPFSKLVSDVEEHDSLTSGEKTIGNYWPYATTVYDYVSRAMPYDSPGSLTPEEVYSLTAFLLKRNNLIDSSLVINSKTLPLVNMPARKFFVADDRTDGPEIR